MNGLSYRHYDCALSRSGKFQFQQPSFKAELSKYWVTRNFQNSPTATPSKMEKCDINSEKSFSDYKPLFYSVGASVLTASVFGIILCKKRCRIQNLLEKLDKVQLEVEQIKQDVRSEIASAAKKTKQMSDNFNDCLGQTPNVVKKLSSSYEQEYLKLVEKDVEILYNPLDPPDKKRITDILNKNELIELNTDFSIIEKSFKPEEIIDTDAIAGKLDGLKAGESVDIPLSEGNFTPVKFNAGTGISAEEVEYIGKTINSDMAINAGKTANWSDEKIARDIFQNFYDSHGHTLDGVKVKITKTAQGMYKVRIDGKGVYSSESIKIIGCSTKETLSSYDAGGFGEGVKMANASMFAKNLSKKITYGSKDWQYDITPGNTYIQRHLTKIDTPVEGSFVEFETTGNFAKKIINAVNYFEHSKNPDFLNSTYSDKDMVIKLLPQGKKGSIYYTQRFEYDGEGNWDNGLDGISICFRKKLSNVAITGRDRIGLNGDNLKSLLDKYTEGVDIDDALDLIQKMYSIWKYEKVPTGTPVKANKILLNSLCARVERENCARLSSNQKAKKLDFSNSKLVAFENWIPDWQYKYLQEQGYTICDASLKSVGMPTVSEMCALFSQHTALQPTQAELKKMRILGEATKVIQELYAVNKTKAFETIGEVKKLMVNNELFTEDVDKFLSALLRIDFDWCDGDAICNIINDSHQIPRISRFIHLDETDLKKLDADTKKKIVDKVKKIVQDKIDCLTKKVLFENSDKDLDYLFEILTPYKGVGVVSAKAEKILKKSGCLPNSQIILKPENPNSPVYLFDKNNELAKDTVAEAIIENNGYCKKTYNGHWIERSHLNNDNFEDLLASWLHETLHQYGGDGEAKFGYKLTDLLAGTFKLSPEQHARLYALRNVFNSIT